jgi:hypothetical protein
VIPASAAQGGRQYVLGAKSKYAVPVCKRAIVEAGNVSDAGRLAIGTPDAPARRNVRDSVHLACSTRLEDGNPRRPNDVRVNFIALGLI